LERKEGHRVIKWERGDEESPGGGSDPGRKKPREDVQTDLKVGKEEGESASY